VTVPIWLDDSQHEVCWPFWSGSLSGPASRPVGRESLFARSDIHVRLARKNIHVLLVAIPGRQDAIHCD
jgi:hypothetical protein